MKTSCIQHPTHDRLFILRQWQIDFCEGNHCAAALLSILEYWHNIKMEMAIKYQALNDVAEQHGNTRRFDESHYQFHTIKNLTDALLGLFGRNKVIEALNYLNAREVISITGNPNKKYHFDKTKFILFHPEICNRWLEENRADRRLNVNDRSFTFGEDVDNSPQENISCAADATQQTQPVDSFDRLKLNDRGFKSGEVVDNVSKETAVSLPDTHENTQVPDLFDRLHLNDRSFKNKRYLIRLDTNTNSNSNVEKIIFPNEASDVTRTPSVQTLDAVGEWFNQHDLPVKVKRQDPDRLLVMTILQRVKGNEKQLLDTLQKAKRYAKASFGLKYLIKILENVEPEKARPAEKLYVSQRTPTPPKESGTSCSLACAFPEGQPESSRLSVKNHLGDLLKHLRKEESPCT